MTRRIDTRAMTTAALMSAFIAVCAAIALPIGVIPGTLQILGVALAALVLAPEWAALSVGTYLLAGAAGLPVFARMTGGLGVLLGPTGGFLWGFLAGAYLGSLARTMLTRRGIHAAVAAAVACGIVLVCAYALGWAQLALVAGLKPQEAALAGVVPFVVPDAIKSAVAIALAGALRRTRVIPAV